MNKIFNNWGFTRIIRLLAGVGTAIYGIIAHDYIFLWIAGLFFIQSIFNLSCCGYNGCSTAPSSDVKQVYKDDIKPLKLK